MNDFKKQCEALNIFLTPRHLQQFEIYLRELQVWNDQFNLTAIRTPEEIISKHFFDSLTVLQALPSGPLNIIDLGTGAGFPGIPLKIARPELHLNLVDSIAKKVSFLDHMIEMLELSDTTALTSRAEEIGQHPQYREHYDVVVNRAMAELPTLAEYSLPLLKVGGLWIAQKGLNSESIADAQYAIKILGGTYEKTIEINVENLTPRQLIIVKKISDTPAQYPRRIGVPLKKPLT